MSSRFNSSFLCSSEYYSIFRIAHSVFIELDFLQTRAVPQLFTNQSCTPGEEAVRRSRSGTVGMAVIAFYAWLEKLCGHQEGRSGLGELWMKILHKSMDSHKYRWIPSSCPPPLPPQRAWNLLSPKHSLINVYVKYSLQTGERASHLKRIGSWISVCIIPLIKEY